MNEVLTKETLVDAVKITRMAKEGDANAAIAGFAKFMEYNRIPMNFSKRVALVGGWAENDAGWIVNRSEGVNHWREIRRG